MKKLIDEEHEEEAKLIGSSIKIQIASGLLSQLKIDSTDSSVKNLLMGFKLALTALSQQANFPIDSIKSKVKDKSQINNRPGDMLEGFLAGKVFSESSKHDNLISFYRENDLMNCNPSLSNGKPCNQVLHDLIMLPWH